VDRLIFSILSVNYLTRENGNKYLRLPADISPYSCAVLPLQKKDGIDSRAKEFFAKYILLDSYAFYDESGSIGRRYARQDEIGTPVCVTFDYDSLKKPETVTVRFRDDTSQIRITTDSILQAGNILNLQDVRKKFN
jgi:glycyl-tRNA synthetase